MLWKSKNIYEYINNQLNILYDRKNKDKYCGDYKFSIDEAKTKLKDILIEKNNKKFDKIRIKCYINTAGGIGHQGCNVKK